MKDLKTKCEKLTFSIGKEGQRGQMGEPQF